MKERGKNPTRRQKELIQTKRLNPDNWLVVKNPVSEMHIVHRISGSKKIIRLEAS